MAAVWVPGAGAAGNPDGEVVPGGGSCPDWTEGTG